MRQEPTRIGSGEPPGSRAARAYAWVTAGPTSFVIPVLWAVVLVLAVLHLPSFSAGRGNDLTPSRAPAIRTEVESAAARGPGSRPAAALPVAVAVEAVFLVAFGAAQ